MIANVLILLLFLATAYGIYDFGCQIYCIFAGIPLKEFPFNMPFGDSRRNSDPPFDNAFVSRKEPHPNLLGGAEAQVQESNIYTQIP